ncbi:hypothetical protein PO183_15525, partial [Bacteroides ovatus]|uniref:hypothetical protein n=1 Tax=Bacteroides ovatus TaxID=28116 RepID=UPI00233F4EEC
CFCHITKVITLKKATNSYPQEIAGEPEANHTSLFKGLFLKARNVPLRGIYFILLQHVALFYITGFSVRFPNFVSLKIEPYGKKKI